MHSLQKCMALVTAHLAMLLAVLANELKQQLYSPVMLVFVGGFLLFLSTSIFFIGNFLDTDLVSLYLQWQFLPWITVVFVPALAMRSFDGYERSGSADFLLSLPLPAYAYIVGKWMSGVTLLLATLAMTFPFVITQILLGNPDWGIIFSGYLAASLFLMFAYALAIFASAMCREKVSSFILGITLLLALMTCSIELSHNSFLADGLNGSLERVFLFSPKFWFDGMVDGNISLSAILYFFVFTAACLLIASLQFMSLRKPSANKFRLITLGLLSFLISAVFSAFVSQAVSELDLNIDLTEQSEFTLHKETINIAQSVPKQTKVTFYFNKDMEEVPLRIRHHKDRIQRMLKRLERVSLGNIQIELRPLEVDTEQAELANIEGISDVPMSSGDILFLGAVAQVGKKTLTIDYFDHSRAALLEYDIALLLSNLLRQKVPKIGILSSILKPINTKEPHPSLSILEALKNQYDVAIIPYFSDSLPLGLDVLIVMDTPVLKQEMLKSIDKHIANGRGALLMIDPYQRMNAGNASLTIKETFDGSINTLADLLGSYGLKFSHGKVVGDDLSASLVQSNSGKSYPFPYWLRLNNERLNSSHTVSMQLNEVLFVESGHFIFDSDNQNIQPIAWTSNRTGEINKTELKNRSAQYLAANFVPSHLDPKHVVVYLNGMIDSPFVENVGSFKSKKASFFAIADSDWIYNGFSVKDRESGGTLLPRPINDNFALFLNMVEYLSGDERLLNIRSRGNPVRSFLKIESMLLESRQAYREREAAFLLKITEAESSISKVMELTGATSIDQLPDDLQLQAMELQTLVYPLKRELRALREKMRETVNALFQKVIFFNILAGPLVLMFVTWLLGFQRRQSAKRLLADAI